LSTTAVVLWPSPPGLSRRPRWPRHPGVMRQLCSHIKYTSSFRITTTRSNIPIQVSRLPRGLFVFCCILIHPNTKKDPASPSELTQRTTRGRFCSQHNNARLHGSSAGCDKRIAGRLYGRSIKPSSAVKRLAYYCIWNASPQHPALWDLGDYATPDTTAVFAMRCDAAARSC
jgi:hypothetical protein